MTKEQQALEERGLIRWQMWLGSGLIAMGVLSIPLFQGQRRAGRANRDGGFAVATGVIGAGAAMLPTGAAAGASACILRSLPDRNEVPDDEGVALNGQPARNLVVTGPETSNGQADKLPQNGR